MRNFILTALFLLASGLVFSQTTNTDTTKSKTTTQGSTKLVKKRMNIAPVKKTTEKSKTKSTGKKEEEGTLPK